MTIKFRKISFDRGVEILRTHTIVGKESEVPSYMHQFNPNDEPLTNDMDIQFLDNGQVLALVSDWNSGYYGDIDGNAPLWYLGEIISD